MLWNTLSLRKFMTEYYKMETDEKSPNHSFICKLKELFSLIDKANISRFTDNNKVYDLYPLRNVLEESDEAKNRFKMEEMADAGEAYGELLDLILKDLSTTNQESHFKSIVGLPLEKHYT